MLILTSFDQWQSDQDTNKGNKLKLVERSFELQGPSGLGEKPRPEMIGPVLTHLRETLQDAVRMGFLHSSRPAGRISSSLKAASEVRYLGHASRNEETTLLRFEVATVGETAGEWFEQQLIWPEGPRAEDTAFELLGAAIQDVKGRKAESNRFDPAFLRRISSHRRWLNQGISSILLPDTSLSETPAIDSALVSTAAELSASTPTPRRVRVAGRLDLMGASQAVLKLDLKPGLFVTALWQGEKSVESLQKFFNRDVVVEGTGVFRPSGSLLRIDADAIDFATPQDDFFRKMPEALSNRDYASSVRKHPGEKAPYSRIIGSIPPEESEEEFARAVEQLS